MSVCMLKKEIERLNRENERLKRELITDDLTGLFNARFLRQRIDQVIDERRKSGEKPSLLFVDVDHFKLINEEHGHLAAGRVLGQVGLLISEEIRKDDIAFRYGGDEFVVLVSGGKVGAVGVGERIRKRIERHVFPVLGLKGAAEVRITVSVGIRVIEAADTTDLVIEAADRAMFEAKRNSRNSLVAA